LTDMILRFFPYNKLNLILCFFLLLAGCEENDYDIEYQDGYPNRLAGNWEAYEFQGGTFDPDNVAEPYDLVTALDPGSDDSLVIDNIYNSGIRVKTWYSGSIFSVTKGKQLEVINMGRYGVHSVSLEGELIEDDDEGDYMLINAGLYDKYDALVDTVFLVAYRKTGFEDVNY